MVDGVDHQQGSTGTKPDQGLDFKDGGYPDPEEFDWFWYHVPKAINAHKQFLEAIDSNEDGKVDAAEQADVATSANHVDGGDVDGQVASAAVADQAKRAEVRNSDPSDPVDGQMWIRSDL